MTVHRVAVVADTHCPEFLDRLPPALPELLQGVEMILHAGDVGGDRALVELSRIAPVVAVRGDHDRGLDLPRRREVEVGGVRVGIIHGNRSLFAEEPLTLVNTLGLGHLALRPGLFRWLRAQFPTARVIVYGHTHTPDLRFVDGVLLFNPGAVYQVTPAAALDRLRGNPGWFTWSWLQVMRHRRRWPAPSVGILEIEEGRIRTVMVPIPPPA